MTWRKTKIKRKSQLIKLTEQKTDPENDENSIDFRWSDVQEEIEEDITKANLI